MLIERSPSTLNELEGQASEKWRSDKLLAKVTC